MISTISAEADFSYQIDIIYFNKRVIYFGVEVRIEIYLKEKA